MTKIYITTIIHDDISIDYELSEEHFAGSWNGSLKFEFIGSGDFSKYIKKDSSINKEKFAIDLINGNITIIN